MKHIKFIIIIILIYLIYTLLNKNKNMEKLDIIYDDENIIEGECEKRKINDSDFFKKIYSIDEKEIIFF
jgi:hypothetical protein